ncbi:hypothetical protein NEIELOOT_00037 [Neisseria elongata subsp. glycolytica ATCC 29315]|uniref:Uncharacterized protein n=1 Tax=Neisseria elongata subsp. glycolytica ATCC 29315 TaxID=546263 RepID=D4DLX7_NEIEG|nr:hypothetical protein NEIELOOT_00037 [Neisseria elongata subsp. glycolytica ATCC 29315]
MQESFTEMKCRKGRLKCFFQTAFLCCPDSPAALQVEFFQDF